MPPTKQYGRSEIIGALTHKKWGGVSPTVIEYDEGRLKAWPAATTIIKRYGSWNSALRDAGLRPRLETTRDGHISEEEVVRALRQVGGRHHGQLPYAEYSRIAREEHLPSGQTVRDRFHGSWTRAKEEAGIE